MEYNCVLYFRIYIVYERHDLTIALINLLITNMNRHDRRFCSLVTEQHIVINFVVTLAAGLNEKYNAIFVINLDRV